MMNDLIPIPPLYQKALYTPNMDKESILQKINDSWHARITIALKQSAIQPVFGDGPATAEIVLIGEAPGKKEDEQGKPFVGASGKFLEELLLSISLSRSDVYVTNVVKYRPPGNRDPVPEEIQESIQWLLEELSIIKPKLIVFLGRHAMSHFFPNEKISIVHGQLIIKHIPSVPTVYFLPLYHPAAALYNGSLRAQLLDDFKNIPIVLKKIKSEQKKTAS